MLHSDGRILYTHFYHKTASAHLQFGRATADNDDMDFSTMNALSTALDYGSTRLQTLSNNLSNVNTPGYKRKDVSFHAMLDAANGDSGTLDMQTSDPRHLTLDDVGARPNPAIVTQNDGAMRPDGNNVDVDAEAARLASAEIYYSGAAQMIAGQFAALKSAIKGD